MSDFSKVGISMLNMDDIASYLKIVRGFITDKDKATDVKKVADVLAEWIAVADTSKHNPDGSIKIDRETIKNALHLDGHPPEYFATKEYGDTINQDLYNTKGTVGEEIKNLRDEVYQLRAELIKHGMLERYTPYAGFYDVFRTGDPVHVNKICDHSIKDSTGFDSQHTIHVSDEFFDSVEVGDHLYLFDNDSARDAIVEIKEKLPDHETLRFTVGAGFDIKKNVVDIYRSKGMIMDGSYTFGEIRNFKVDDSTAMYTGLNDDTYAKKLPLDKDNPGYGYTFRIPRNMQKSYLSKISIMIQAFGNPSDLVAYVIDERNIPTWNKIKKAGMDGEILPDKDDAGQPLPTKLKDLIIARSQPLCIDASKGMHLAEFSFYGTENIGSTYGFSNPNPYPYMPLLDDEDEHRVRYCLIIEPVGPLDKYNPQDLKNCYLMEFLKQTGNGPDLQLNNITYHYDKEKKAPFWTNQEVNSYDLYYGITLLRAIQKVYVPLGTGIYTARFKQPVPLTSSRARLMLRIRREGMFHVAKNTQSNAAGNIRDHSTVMLESEDTSYVPDFSGSNGKQVIIGSTICRVEDASNLGSITIEKGLHIDPEAPVYPVGYEVTLKAYYDEWDPVNFATVTKYKDKFKMPLYTVIPDQYKQNKKLSDRLLFECDLFDTNKNIRPYNRFEIEIFWKKNREKNDTTKLVEGSTEYPLVAAIHDLSLSLDRAL